MARQTVNPQQPSVAGGLITYTAGHVDGHAIPNSGRTIIHIKNTGGAPVNVTFQTPPVTEAGAVPDKVVSIVNETEQIFGRLNPALFNQGDGTIWLDFATPASIQVAVYEA